MPQGNRITFRCEQPFVGADEEPAILGVEGVAWFLDKLKRIPTLVVEPKLVQEDWGVVIYVVENRQHFWIGLGFFDENCWIVHVNHNALLQRLTPSGKAGLARLAESLYAALITDSTVSEVCWFEGQEPKK